MLNYLLMCLRATYTHTKEGGDFAVTYRENTLYLLFQWSDGHEDWKNNLAFSAQCVNPLAPKRERWYCHRGFLKVWRAMREEIISLTAWYLGRYDVREIICVGYSHGAALSLLATHDMTSMFGQKMPVMGYGFGCPRVVRGKLPRQVKNDLARFTAVRNIPDLVTYLPPKLFGFRHVGLCTIGEQGTYNPIDAHRAESYIQVLAERKWPSKVFSYGVKANISRCDGHN